MTAHDIMVIRWLPMITETEWDTNNCIGITHKMQHSYVREQFVILADCLHMSYPAVPLSPSILKDVAMGL